MKELIQHKIANYRFFYDENLSDDFSNLGYSVKDLEQIAQNLIAYLKNTPPKLRGDRIKQSGGAVKVRISKASSTRGNEDRLIYSLLHNSYFVFMRIYTKSRKEDLSKKEVKELRTQINQYSELLTMPGRGFGIGAIGVAPADGKVYEMRSADDNDELSSFIQYLKGGFEFVDDTINLE